MKISVIQYQPFSSEYLCKITKKCGLSRIPEEMKKKDCFLRLAKSLHIPRIFQKFAMLEAAFRDKGYFCCGFKQLETKPMTQKIFILVRDALLRLAQIFRTTYNTVNIIVYYLLVPLTWTLMLDYKLQVPYSTLILLAVWVVIIMRTWGRFEKWCDWAFMKSVDFLLWFQKIGWNYVVASVIICVLLPLLIYIALILI